VRDLPDDAGFLACPHPATAEILNPLPVAMEDKGTLRVALKMLLLLTFYDIGLGRFANLLPVWRVVGDVVHASFLVDAA
jgi:hypothetical protein